MQFEVENLEEVKQSLEKQVVLITQKTRRLMSRLADIGIREADINFRYAQYDGTNDVEVAPAPQWISETELEVRASGTAVLFIEFGAGVFYSEPHPVANLVMARGTYGQGKGGTGKPWTYYGEAGTNGEYVTTREKGDVYRTKGNPANRSMYDAAQEMRRSIAEIAREVFAE